jgi:DNA-binding MarR family transcriptional regulator
MSDLEPLVSEYARLYLKLMRTLDRRMAEEGASLARTKLLICLQKNGPMRGTEIAEFFNQSPRTVTEALDGLEVKGLVVREQDPTDRRAKLVRITAKGEAAVRTTEPLRQRILEQTFGVLDEGERRDLHRLLEKVSGALSELSAEESGRK